MNNLPVIVPDTSVISEYFYSDSTDGLSKKEHQLNSMMKQIAPRLPFDSINDCTIIIPTSILLEVIGKDDNKGIKQVLNNHTESLNNCFPLASDTILPKEMYKHSPKETSHTHIALFDNYISKAFNNIRILLTQLLSPNLIIQKIDKFIQKYSCIPTLREQLAALRNDIINHGTAHRLYDDLAWDIVVKKDDWYDNKNDKQFIEMKSSGIDYVIFDAKHITKRLMMFYCELFQNNDYLHGSVLYTKYAKQLDPKINNQYDQNELGDPYLVEYACSGLYDNKTQQRKQAIILTCDEGIKKRIPHYLENKKIINQDLEKVENGAYKKQEFLYGYIITIKAKTNDIDPIDISKL